MVIGTTGFDDAGKQAIREASQEIVKNVFKLSVGVNARARCWRKRRRYGRL